MRILLDTNILISGMMRRDTPPGQLVDLWIEGVFEIVTGEAQIEELRRVLERPAIASRVHADRAAAIVELLAAARAESKTSTLVHDSPDPDDNLILAIAVAGRADLIVSGDKPGMLALGEIHGVPIVTATEALGRLVGLSIEETEEG